MWEASELPEANREMLHEYDQIIVPSMENFDLYSRHHPNVAYVPLGIGPEWHYRPRDELFYNESTIDLYDLDGDRMEGRAVPLSAPSFRFMCAGTSISRKGIDLTAEAFAMAFPDRMMLNPRPELIFKSPLGVTPPDAVTQTINGYMPDADEIDLYAGIHCFVSLARGEGFGLQPLQAMAMGIPTILTDAHGHKAFAAFGIPVPARLVPAPEEMGFGEAGEWWEADVLYAAERMRAVYEDYALFAQQAAYRSTIIHERFSWHRSAQLLLDAIGEENLNVFPQTSGFDMWHGLEPMKYLIRVTVPYAGTVNGMQYRYEPGVDYWDVADIKRQIGRQGILDHSCIGVDGIVKADSRLSGAHSYCPTCQQRLNTNPTKADDILASLEA